MLLRAYDEEARLSPFGRLMVRGELTTVLANRLRVEQAWRQQPALLEPIQRVERHDLCQVSGYPEDDEDISRRGSVAR